MGHQNTQPAGRQKLPVGAELVSQSATPRRDVTTDVLHGVEWRQQHDVIDGTQHEHAVQYGKHERGGRRHDARWRHLSVRQHELAVLLPEQRHVQQQHSIATA